MHEVCKISATCPCFQGGACIESIFFWVTSFVAVSNGRIRPADTAPAKKSTAKTATKKKHAFVASSEPDYQPEPETEVSSEEPVEAKTVADPISETSQKYDDTPAPTPAKAGSIFNFANTAA